MHHLVPLVDGQFDEWFPQHPDPGVVHQNVTSTVFLLDPFAERCYGLCVGQVARHYEGLSALLFNFCFYPRQSRLIAGGEQYSCAHACEPECDCLTDSARGACHHRNLVGQWSERIDGILSLWHCALVLGHSFTLSEAITASIIHPQLIGKTLVFPNGSPNHRVEGSKRLA